MKSSGAITNFTVRSQVHSKPPRISNTRSRALPLALLCLIAHALLVSLTHHHGHEPIQTPQATASLSSGESNGTTTSNSESDCLSCRLQRNFNSLTHPGATALETLQAHVNKSILLSELYCYRLPLILSGRAPPLA
jgi:hypothetical protein